MAGFICIPLSVSPGSSPVLLREEGELEKSIDNILDLIIFTPKGSFSADPEFGFEYWNHEFSNMDIREFNNNYVGLMSSGGVLNEISRRECEDSIRESILAYEPRLLQPDVKISLNPSDKVRNGNRISKYEMRITVTGAIDDGLGVRRQYEKRVAFMVEPVAHKINI
ncbi:MAG: GPW/gp25 family protein [Bacteroidetes bacterium]|uniref:GPW/gp25 family protein n=1 Tax=Candidatus Cryptobacteroides merdavium TaxID=2840769 RepID=A0A9D9HDF0_9BACT|nr:GPW/gp25 family protein [Candidatus Cryptobacteroides merdavium]